MENNNYEYIHSILVQSFNEIKNYVEQNNFAVTDEHSIENKSNKQIYNIVKEMYTQFLHEEKILDSIITSLNDLYEILHDKKSKETFEWYIKFSLAGCLLGNLRICEELFPFNTKPKLYYDMLFYKKVLQNDNIFSIKHYTFESDYETVYESWIGEIYKLDNICYPKKGDIILDIGAYKGETSLWFADQIQYEGIVYAFEAIDEFVCIIEKNIEKNNLHNKIKCLNTCLYSEPTEIFIHIDGSSSACDLVSGDRCISADTIDSVVLKNNIDKVDYIKLDIEGLEYKVLEGASNTIRKDKPCIAVCVYHNFMDVIEIPNLIKRMVPEYKIYLSNKLPAHNCLIIFASIIN